MDFIVLVMFENALLLFKAFRLCTEKGLPSEMVVVL